MIRIGIDARLTHYRVGGISTYVRHMIKALEKLESQHHYTVFQSRQIRHAMTSSLAEQFHTARLWTPPHHRYERWALSVELLPYRLHVLHSPDFIPPQRGAKHHIITVHDLTFLHYPEHKDQEGARYYTQQIAWAVKHADHILAVSEATKRDLMSLLAVPEAKITVQPHGVHTREYPGMQQGEQPAGRMLTEWLNEQELPERFILHVGTLEPRKNIPVLLQAYAELRRKIDDAPALLFVGQVGWLHEPIMAEIKRHQRDGAQIFVRSDISDTGLGLLYNRAEMLVLPSLYEGFGLPPLEAMACGTPVVASNNSSLPEVVGDAGLLIDPHDPQNLADAMQTALTDSAWRAQARERGFAQAALFSWENSARIALRVYEQVARG